MSQYVKERGFGLYPCIIAAPYQGALNAFSGYAHAPVVATVNIITMAVNTLAARECPRAPALL